MLSEVFESWRHLLGRIECLVCNRSTNDCENCQPDDAQSLCILSQLQCGLAQGGNYFNPSFFESQFDSEAGRLSEQ